VSVGLKQPPAPEVQLFSSTVKVEFEISKHTLLLLKSSQIPKIISFGVSSVKFNLVDVGGKLSLLLMMKFLKYQVSS
jgi:hypothetical protein